MGVDCQSLAGKHTFVMAVRIILSLLLVVCTALPSPRLVKREADPMSNADGEIAVFNAGFIGHNYYRPYGYGAAWGYGSSNYGYHSMAYARPNIFPNIYGRYLF